VKTYPPAWDPLLPIQRFFQLINAAIYLFEDLLLFAGGEKAELVILPGEMHLLLSDIILIATTAVFFMGMLEVNF
jgi:hypothetical protein